MALCGATPVLLAAQDAGTLRGRVVDEQRLPVAAAQVSIRPLAGDGAAVTVETTDDGTFSRGSIPSGLYTVTAGKDDLRGDMFRVRIRAGRTVRVNVELAAGRRDAAWIAELGDREAASRAFAAGVRASRAADHATAVEQFLRAITRTPDCAACHYNLAIAYSELDRFADAETAFRQVVELTPDYSAAYYGLASIYTRRAVRTTPGQPATKPRVWRVSAWRTGAGGSRETLQQSVARLDAGDTAGALAALEMLLKRDSSFAPTRYWLGVALLGIDEPDRAATQFQRYLELDGDGEHGAHARAALADLNR